MAIEFLLAGLGLLILLLAGDALVRGAVNLSLRLGVPAMIVSLTIVAFGTSAPELLISTSAVLEGVAGLALGNVVGSNIANVLLVLGVPALLKGLDTADCDTQKSFMQMCGATLIFVIACFFGPITWVHGTIFLIVLMYILADALKTAISHRALCKQIEDDEQPEGADPNIPSYKIALYLTLGLIGLPLGANLLVENAVEIASEFGVSETVIGLTLVAVGTSLPELATTVMAAYHRQAGVALGNVIGSNTFNLLAIIGITTFVGPIPVAAQILSFDLWVMVLATLVLIPFVFFGQKITRSIGIALTGLYAGYIVAVISL